MTRAELVARLRQQADDAERFGATAPVATVLRDVLNSVQGLDGVPDHPPCRESLMTLDEASTYLRVTTRWLRETRPPYVIEISPKQLRVDPSRLPTGRRFAGRPLRPVP